MKTHPAIDPDRMLLAQVFVGKYQGTIVAIKLLLHVDESALERFRREVAILAGGRRHHWACAVHMCCVHLGARS